MKRNSLYKFLNGMLAMFAVVAIIACTADDVPFEVQENTESRLVEVKIGVSTPERDKAEVTTKVVDENAVSDLYVFVFDASGKIVFKQYYDEAALNVNGETYQGNTTTENTNYITATVPVGQAYIYGFANINSDIYGNIKSQLDAINTREALLGASVNIQSTARNLTRVGATYLMAGICADANKDYYTITATTREIKHIRLKRLDSEITFNFSAANSNSTFTALDWYCVNAPASSMLLEKRADRASTTYGNWDASNNAADFYTTYESKKYIDGNSFTFYIPENRKVSKNIFTDYKERERETLENKQNHVPGTPRIYENAPDNATYVVVHGTYEGTTDASQQEGTTGEQQVSADVTYVIHLGYLNNDADDFFSNRNTKYTYNVKVAGVNSIVVEVESKGDEDGTIENVPGATGEVVFLSSSNIYKLDSHYETVLLEFEINDLVSRYRKAQEIEGKRFHSAVSTPYSNMTGVDGEKDRAWVKIVQNNNAEQTLATYNKDAAFLTVDGLLDELEVAVESYLESDEQTIPAPFNAAGKVTYTCFVDEYYYDEADLPVAKSGLADNGVNIWKSFANQPDRKLYLLCATQNSEDGESSLVNSAYILEQRSIRTFYSTDPSTGQVIAYGVETINETGKLNWKGSQGIANPASTNDGWANFKTLVNGAAWNTIINHPANGYTNVEMNKAIQSNSKENLQTNDMNFLQGMNNAYQYAYIACMQRNRNESGSDNVADADLKWYLPAVEQMQAFYIGEQVLEEAQLFHYPEVANTANSQAARGQVYKHFATSTDRDRSNNDYGFYILWSEEGTSVSTMAERNSWANNSGNGGSYWSNYNYHYRCVRYLGTDNSRSGNEPYDSYMEYNNNVVTYDLLNSKVRNRSKVTNGNLGSHEYDEEGNELYAGGFEVYTRNLSASQNYLTSSNDNCSRLGNGWRIPNLREMTLMRQLEISGLNTLCRTRFKYDFRDTWSVSSATANIQMQGLTNSIRCVRDIN